MRQTFQQWMVLLSALVLLLLPALLCHATPMESASSSGDSSGIKSLEYYISGPFRLAPNSQPLTRDALDKDFGTHIHYDGAPVLFRGTDRDAGVTNALSSYGKVWLVDRTSGGVQPRYLQLYKTEEGEGRVLIDSEGKVHLHVENVEKHEAQYGKEARYLTYGRPFAKPKKSRLRFLRFLRFFGYKKPNWKKVSTSQEFNLEETGLATLRTRLQDEEYLKGYVPSHNKLLGFALAKDGTVLFKDFSERVRV
ncbi:uncharacterized protein UDID_18155 [Ustilago sp. UG-2017a]|nr:uncharacterized protein UDID_18155 [Ustilago sp. UG-2017a]